ncbi:hypothetical protein HCH_03357 [Hahella chejuensis KCTC 2396]|uniref:DUF1565 domain-containing protein n=1 Tax=Hahella chejuensis (strain KCTC 2396) TaxID=349521 RepID=Q2SGW3_HAHCH|nr:hypothetical protein [Hahella chejuensis]ABC30111.1 hypothetical protein HCH_03357 [Hahella chejuensis KCTC 2396]
MDRPPSSSKLSHFTSWSLYVFTALSLSLQIHAKSLYVDINASPTGNCTKSSPCQSINTAISKVAENDVINVAEGVYFEDVDFGGLSYSLSLEGQVVVTAPTTLNCGADSVVYCPVLVPEEDLDIAIEGSGLSYNADLGIWVGVSDNGDELVPQKAGRYMIFYFDPTKISIDGKISVSPLLSESQAQEWQMFDLEGITYNPSSGVYYAMSSLSLHKSNPARDTWYRYQGYNFTLSPSKSGGYQANNLTALSLTKRRDLREWVISSGGVNWPASSDTSQNVPPAITGRAETGNGINVEGVAFAGSNSSGDNIFLGFRGPLFRSVTPFHLYDALVLSTTFNGNAEPMPDQQLFVTGIKNAKFFKQGIRGLDSIPNYTGWFVVIFGQTDTQIEPLNVFLWNSDSGEVQSVQTLPNNFVAEGVSAVKVIENSSKSVLIYMIDDSQAYVMSMALAFSP